LRNTKYSKEGKFKQDDETWNLEYAEAKHLAISQPPPLIPQPSQTVATKSDPFPFFSGTIGNFKSKEEVPPPPQQQLFQPISFDTDIEDDEDEDKKVFHVLREVGNFVFLVLYWPVTMNSLDNAPKVTYIDSETIEVKGEIKFNKEDDQELITQFIFLQMNLLQHVPSVPVQFRVDVPKIMKPKRNDNIFFPESILKTNHRMYYQFEKVKPEENHAIDFNALLK